MTEENNNKENKKEETKNINSQDGGKKNVKRERAPVKRRIKRKTRERTERRQEFEQKIVDIRRVVRVMAGGRRFSFSVAMILGDKKGRVGVGVGKAGDTSLAIQKAVRVAKKNMITVDRTANDSIPHDVEAKYGASVVQIRPAKGRGLVAGAAARTVLELAGVTDITAKILTRSKNKINIARATISALKKLDKKD